MSPDSEPCSRIFIPPNVPQHVKSTNVQQPRSGKFNDIKKEKVKDNKKSNDNSENEVVENWNKG